MRDGNDNSHSKPKDQLETEFRKQIEAVLSAGPNSAHLDWHSLRSGERGDIFDLMLKLAREHRLALRVAGRSSIEKVQSQGLPSRSALSMTKAGGGH